MLNKNYFWLIVGIFSLFPDMVSAGWIGFGTYPTVTTAQCLAQNGTCRTRAPGFDGCTLGTDRFIGYCDVNNGAGCCIPTETIINNESLCTAAGGQCSINDANCFKLNPNSTGPKYDPIGYCDGATERNACCKLGAATGGSGATEYCENVQKGTCLVKDSQGKCSNGGTEIGICGADGSGTPRICCAAPGATGGNTGPIGKLNYTLLEEIPGSTTGVTGNLATYLQNLYKFTFWAIGVAALFMLTVGGFMYVTSAGNTSRVETAKTIITDSLLGIIVALFAWLFLYVINPDLVEGLQLANTAPTGGTTTPAPGTPPGATGGTLSHAAAIAALGSGITLSSSGNCSDQKNPSCTSLEGIPATVIDRVKNLRDKSGCSLTITGGTEVGHRTHGPGLGSIDFSESNCLGTFLQNNITKHSELGIQRICATTTWFSKVGASCTESYGAPHFHIQFST